MSSVSAAGILDGIRSERHTSPMEEGLERLLGICNRGLSAAWCLVVSTEGTTNARVGQGAVVSDDGGGLVWSTLGAEREEELVQAARQAIRDGYPLFVEWDAVGPADSSAKSTSGKTLLLIDPVQRTADSAYYETLVRTLRGGKGCTEAIRISPAGDGTNPGTRVLFDRKGRVLACRGEDLEPSRLAAFLRPLRTHAKPYLEQGIAFFPLAPRVRLVLIGGGPLAEEVCRLAVRVDFEVLVVDDLPERVEASRFPDAKDRIAGSLEDAAGALSLDEETFVAVIRRDYSRDLAAMKLLAGRPLGYLGMIGNQSKVRSVLSELRERGLSESRLAKIRAPLGLCIGSRTVNEIAISIVAELIAQRNLESGAPSSPAE